MKYLNYFKIKRLRASRLSCALIGVIIAVILMGYRPRNFHQEPRCEVSSNCYWRHEITQLLKLSFASLNMMLAVILMGSLTSENPSEAQIRIFTKPRFTILHDQLEIVLESYAHRLAMEQFFVTLFLYTIFRSPQSLS